MALPAASFSAIIPAEHLSKDRVRWQVSIPDFRHNPEMDPVQFVGKLLDRSLFRLRFGETKLHLLNSKSSVYSLDLDALTTAIHGVPGKTR